MATTPFLHTHCPQCGAEMNYGGKALACKKCGYKRKLGEKSDMVAPRALTEGIDLSYMPRGLDNDHSIFECGSCKVKLAMQDPKTDVRCPFCDGETTRSEAEINVIKPYGLLPFTIPHKRAPGMFASWVKKVEWFLKPFGMSKIGDPRRVRAVYVPYFTFDAITRSSWVAQSGYRDIFIEDYKAAQTKADVKDQIPKLRWETSRGYFEHLFSNTMIPMGKKVDANISKKLKMYDLVPGIVEAYDPLYIREFICQLYTDEEMKGFAEVDKLINEKNFEFLKDEEMFPGDSVKGLKIATEKLGISFKHILMPVWVSYFTYRGETHTYYLNGRNGKIFGKTPLSFEKVAIAIAIGVVLLIILVLALR